MSKKSLAVLLVVGILSLPALAVPKEIVALQQQVALLMAEVQDLQRGFNSNVAVIKSLLTQNTDTVNKLQLAVKAIQTSLNRQTADAGQTQTQLGQQFQSLNDSIAALQARLNKLNETLTQMQQAQQTLQPPPVQSAATGPLPGGAAAPPAAAGTAAANAPVLPPAQLYKNAITDYVAGAYPLAQNEFSQFVAAYASDDHAPAATYYLGDIYMKGQQYKDAIKMFDQVLNKYPDDKVAAGAQLKKGYSLIALRERGAGIREFRSLISHYPTSQEAKQAKQELASLGVAKH